MTLKKGCPDCGRTEAPCAKGCRCGLCRALADLLSGRRVKITVVRE